MALSACTQSEFSGAKRDPSPLIDGAYFGNSLSEATLGFSEENPTIKVPILRTNSAGSLTVALSYESEGLDKLSGMPSSATFADGSAVTEISITADALNMAYNDPVELTITLSDNNTPYGLNVVMVKINKSLIWEKDENGEDIIKVAKYSPGIFPLLYGIPTPYFWYVKYQKAEGMDFYRLIRPWGPVEDNMYGGYIIGNPDIWEEELVDFGDEDADPTLYDIIINFTDPDNVTFGYTPLGFAWGEGPVSMGTLNSLNPSRYSAGKLVDNILEIQTYLVLANFSGGSPQSDGVTPDFIQFDVKAPVIGPAPKDDYDETTVWNAAGQGYFASELLSSRLAEDDDRDIVAGVVKMETSPSESASETPFRIPDLYTSLWTSGAYEGYYNLDFTFDRTTGNIAAVADQALGIYLNLDDSTLLPVFIENATVTKDGEYTFYIEADFYLLDKKEDGETDQADDIIYPLGSYVETLFWNQLPPIGYTWESIGTGTFLDGLLPTAYLAWYDEGDYDPADWTWEVNVQQAKEKPTLYRIADAYSAVDGDLADVVSLADNNIVIDTEFDGEAGVVSIDFQSIGIDYGLGEVYIGSAYWYGLNEPLGTFADGVIDFGVMVGEDDGGAGYIEFPMTLTLPGATAPAVAAYKPYKFQPGKLDSKKTGLDSEMIDKIATQEPVNAVRRSAPAAVSTPVAPRKVKNLNVAGPVSAW